MILSIDVGIQNLALCVLDKDAVIHKWCVIDLTAGRGNPTNPKTDQLETPKCCLLACKRDGKYSTVLGETTLTWCGLHAKKSSGTPLRIPSTPLEKRPIATMAKQTKAELIQIATDLHVPQENEGLPIAKMTKLALGRAIEKTIYSQCFRVVVGNSQGQKEPSLSTSKTMDLIAISKALKEVLDREFGKDTDCSLTDVVIENQIAPIATRMKTVQGMILQYFVDRGPASLRISFASSRNKLSLGHPTEIATGAVGYSKRKQQSIVLCRNRLEKGGPWMELFETSAKKDDLADCFLQGLYYLRKIG